MTRPLNFFIEADDLIDNEPLLFLRWPFAGRHCQSFRAGGLFQSGGVLQKTARFSIFV